MSDRQRIKENNPVSRYIIPFLVNDYSRFLNVINLPGSIWNDDNYTPYYLTENVKEIISNGVTVKKLSDDGKKQFGIPLKDEILELCSGIKKKTGDERICEKYECNINSVKLYGFDTGLALTVVEFVFPYEYYEKEIADFNFAFSTFWMYPEENANLSFFTRNIDGEKKIHLFNCINNIMLYTDEVKPYCVDKLQSYHVICTAREKINPEWEKYGALISRALSGNSLRGAEKTNRGFSYNCGEGVCWLGDTRAVVAHLEYVESDEYVFVRDTYRNNCLQDYFFIYLLCVYEKELLQYISKEILHRYGKVSQIRKIEELKRKLLLSKVKYQHSTISYETNYQTFYERMQSVFDFANNLDDVNSTLQMADEYKKERRGRQASLFEVLLSIFGGVGIIGSCFGIIEYFEKSFGTIHLICLAVLCVLYGICIFVAFRNRK